MPHPNHLERESGPEAKEAIPKAEFVYFSGETPTPPAIFEFWLQKLRGRVADSYEAIPSLTTPSGASEAKEILSLLREGNLRDYWLELIEETCTAGNGHNRWLLRRMANYFNHCQTRLGRKPPLENLANQGASFYLYGQLTDVSLRHFSNPLDTLEKRLSALRPYSQKSLSYKRP